ncbi:MAG: alpha-mannosidase [Chloroflexi bacterium]|nr:alpha-mannosidase [Chloroflexota bacterium]
MDQVRIKDKMRSAYTPQQWMGVQIEKIKTARFSESLKLEGWKIREAIYHGPGNYEWLDQQWRLYQVGDEWGGENRTAFFRCEAKVPENFAGKYCVLYLKPGGEGLLTLNGKQLAGLDSKHEVVFLSEQMKGGETLQIEIEQYVNEMEIPRIVHRFSVAELAVLDRDSEDAYFDLKCAYDLVMTPQAGNEVRAFLFDELKKAISLLDPSTTLRAGFEGDGEKFRASLRKARSYVRDHIYDSGRFQHHGRLNMVGHSHLDFVYQWDYSEFLRKIGRTHATTLNMMREFPDYLFCQSQMKLYEDLKSLYPEIYAQIKERVQEGRWEVIGGMYVEPDCNLISGESFVRQLQFGREFARREFGTTSSVCWLPDVFGIAWFVPQILQRAGFRFLITNKPVIWNDTNEFPHNTFWWEGPDGSRILAHLPATHFGASIDADVMLTNWNEYKQKVACSEVIYNYGYADGRGGPSREDVLSGRRYKNMPGMPQALFTHGEEAFERIEARAEGLPVWKDELYLETHRGTYTTQARLKKNNRKAEILYRNAEAMSALASLLGGSYPQEDLHEGWRLILKNQFHDILPGSHVTQALHDALKDYETVFAKGHKALTSALSYIGNQISSESAVVAVFNMQPWARTDVVEAEFRASPATSCQIVDANGNNVPFQVLGQDDGRVRVLIEAGDVPPLGYTVYRLVAGQPDVSTPFIVHGDSIENDFFQVRFDEQGTISGIYDKKNDRQAIAQGNKFQLFEDVPGRYAAWDIVPMYKDREFAVSPVERSEIAENGPVRLVLRQERSFMKSKMVQRIILYRRLPRIDFATEIEWGERDRLLKAGFLVNVNAMRATYDMSYGYIERATHANTSWDAAKFEVCGHLWADLSEGDYGVSLLNDCKYGYDIFGHRMRLTLLRGPQYPDPTADWGHHSFTYSLYPHRGDWRQAETPRRAWELNDPLMAIPIGAGGGNLQSTGSFLSIDSDHVMLSALKMAEEGDGLILRLYEDQNRRGTVKVTFPSATLRTSFHPPSRAIECDPYENEIGPADVVSGSLRFDIKPFEVRTFKLYFN